MSACSMQSHDVRCSRGSAGFKWHTLEKKKKHICEVCHFNFTLHVQHVFVLGHTNVSSERQKTSYPVSEYRAE